MLNPNQQPHQRHRITLQRLVPRRNSRDENPRTPKSFRPQLVERCRALLDDRVVHMGCL